MIVAAAAAAAALSAMKPSFVDEGWGLSAGGVPVSESSRFYDMSAYVGAEYTPWKASNQLWWYDYSAYRADVERELKMVKEVMQFNTLRMFLHSMLFAANSTGLKANMHDFLDLCEKLGYKAGFVFFDDCWNHAGANLTSPCIPRKGVHNGCWMASPQDVERTDVDRFQPYVSELVAEFKDDSRVAWWEIFNEPSKTNSFTNKLRDAGFQWAKAVGPSQPIISCWDDNKDTEVVDHHQYNLPWGANNAVFANPSKGGIVTEAGARWYQKRSSDSGSPLTVINWLTALRRPPALRTGYDLPGHDMAPCGADGCVMNASASVGDCEAKCKATSGCQAFVWAPANCSGAAGPICWTKSSAGRGGAAACRDSKVVGKRSPFIPGVMIDWEVMTGHSQTRWHWGDKEGIPEPPVPWHSHVYPDGTPVSFTEAAAIRAYVTGVEDFVYLSTWLDRDDPDSDEKYLTLAADKSFGWLGEKGTSDGALYEMTIWPEEAHGDTFQVALTAKIMVILGPGLGGKNMLNLTVDGKLEGSFDVDSLQGGLVQASWNMLRVLVESNRIRVWFNPYFSDCTGGSVPPQDEKKLIPMPPRIDATGFSVAADIPGFILSTAASNRGAFRVDYVSVLPPKLYGMSAQ